MLWYRLKIFTQDCELIKELMRYSWKARKMVNLERVVQKCERSFSVHKYIGLGRAGQVGKVLGYKVCCIGTM